jgi:hypothetical protein
MPEISRFFGIIIKMFFSDHHPPHFHAYYGDDQVLIEIDSFAVVAGYLPARALGLVIEWATLHQNELLINWEKASALEPLMKIPPLK